MWRSGSKVAPFIYRVARNLAIDRLRARERDRRHLAKYGAGRPEAHESPEAALEAAERVAAVRRCVAGLPEPERSMIELYQQGLGDMTLEEVAEVLGVATATAHRIKERAMQRLRECLGRLLES
jgi:RNA polymerase sigma factor (sigma-70 family)